MNSKAALSEASLRKYDRAVALFEAAVIVGIAVIWLARLAHYSSNPGFSAWIVSNAGKIGEYLTESAFTVWLCAGVFKGRRWALAGLAFEHAHDLVKSIYGRQFGAPEVVVVAITLYLAIRLGLPMGRKRPRGATPDRFLPDRIVTVTMALIDAGTLTAFLLNPLPGSVVDTRYVVWFLLLIPGMIWRCWALYQSRGWAIGVSFMGTLLGFFVEIPHPEQRLQRGEAILGFLYFGLRLTAIGPRPRGFLGMQSD